MDKTKQKQKTHGRRATHARLPMSHERALSGCYSPPLTTTHQSITRRHVDEEESGPVSTPQSVTFMYEWTSLVFPSRSLQCLTYHAADCHISHTKNNKPPPSPHPPPR